MIEMNPLVLNHIFEHLPLLLNRDFLLDVFTHSEKNKATIVENDSAKTTDDCYLYEGKFLNIDKQLCVISNFEGLVKNAGQSFKVKSLGIPADDKLCDINSPVTLPPGILANYTGDTPLETTIGRILLNYTIFVDPFGSLIPYVNQLWNIGAIESGPIFDALRTESITVDQIKHYSRNLHFIGHFTELSVPNFTERSLTVDPAIIKRRDELLEEHRAEIEAGDVVVMSKIEAELIAMDKASLKGDVSTSFYDYEPGKSYDVHRKTMYLLRGIVAGFGDDTSSFVEGSLEDGWNVKDFPALCNQIRDGSYARAKETAKGGEETKFLIRVFQSTQITEQDCQSTKYLNVLITKDNASKYQYRTILDNGTLVLLTQDNVNSYIGKTVQMRSPMNCHTKDGYCYTCMGELFRTINADLLTMAAINVGKTFTIAALKKMHSVSAKRIEIKSLNSFAI